MQATKNAIVAAANLPMSILIVGVGNEQFDAMNELDGDEGQVSGSGLSILLRLLIASYCF